MKRIGCLLSVVLLCVSFSWGQGTGVMPRRSMPIKLPTQRQIENKVDVPVEGETLDELLKNSESKKVTPIAFEESAVDMLGFDKRLSDTKESFLLRNNTPYHLSRVMIKLVYRAPDGQMINYRTQIVECDLLPQSTRRCEIPSFDTSKSYYHVDAPPARTSGRPFKVTFQLLRYDVVIEP